MNVLAHQFVQQLALYVWLFHGCLCLGLISFGDPDRRPPLREDVAHAPHIDDAEPTPLFSLRCTSLLFQHSVDGRQLGLDLLEFSMTVIGGMAVGWAWALPNNKGLVHTMCICDLVIAST